MEHKSLSLLEAVSEVLIEGTKFSPEASKAIEAHEKEKELLNKIFNQYEAKINVIRKKANDEIKKLKAEQAKKSSEELLKLNSNFKTKMKSLGYEFKAPGGWAKIK